MRICLLTEGSYPYVVGGVSSWIQMLIEGMPEHEFVVYSIGAEEKDRGKFKYKLPVNLKSVQEVFLDSILQLKSPAMTLHCLNEEEKEWIADLLRGTVNADIDKLASIFRGPGKKPAMQIFMSADFFDIIEKVYIEKYNYLPFTDFFWTMRSMLVPLFYLMQQELPQADIYHSVATGYSGVLGGIAGRAGHKPFLITEHGIYSREREEEIIKCSWAEGDFKTIWIQYFYTLAHLAYQSADQVYTLFEKNAEIEEQLGCAADKIHIVPNGIRMERFAGIAPLEAHDGYITVGAAVRVVPIKDIVTMLRAFRLAQAKMPDMHFEIMGQYEEDPEYYGICQQTVKTIGLKYVNFTGSVNVADYYGHMDLLVLSSISEGQPLAVIEGMASARPFVATDVGCCRELLYGSHGDTLGCAGILAAAMDYEAIARSILQLATDVKLRREMGCIGRERVQAGYTYEQFIQSYRDIYTQAERGKR